MEKRTRRSVDSVMALFKVLTEVNSTGIFNSEQNLLIQSLGTQGAMAKLHIEELQIRGMSLNTLKRIANDHLVGGFDRLDELRKACLVKLAGAKTEEEHQAAKRSDTRRALQNRVLELEQTIDRLNEDFMFLSERLGVAMKQARIYAVEAGTEATARCRREQREMLNSLGLRPRVGDLNGPRALS